MECHKSSDVCLMLILCVLDALQMRIGCSSDAHGMIFRCVVNALQMCVQCLGCSINAHRMLKLWASSANSIDALSMLKWWASKASSILNGCSSNAHQCQKISESPKKASPNSQKIAVPVRRRPSKIGKRHFRRPLEGPEFPMLKNPGVDYPMGGRVHKKFIWIFI